MTKPILGVLGGLGPLATAEFLNTIYELNPHETEQDGPTCLVLCDPSMPDRTEAILRGTPDKVTTQLSESLDVLLRMGATRIVVPCVTMHHFLPLVPARLVEKVVSLIDIAVRDIQAVRGTRLLMLCSLGTRKARIFESRPDWNSIQSDVVFPRDEDQEKIHAWIGELKRGGLGDAHVAGIQGLVEKSGAAGFIACCTEFHLVTKRISASDPQPAMVLIDPLITVAKRIDEILGRRTP